MEVLKDLRYTHSKMLLFIIALKPFSCANFRLQVLCADAVEKSIKQISVKMAKR